MARYEENKDTDEMEQYGVWVKIQPEVIDESTIELDEDLNSYQLSDIESDKVNEDLQIEDENDENIAGEDLENESLNSEDINKEFEDNNFEIDDSELSLEADFTDEDKLELPEEETDFSADEIPGDTELDFNMPEEELALPGEDMLEFPEEDELILPGEDNQAPGGESKLDFPEEEQLDIAEISDTDDIKEETTVRSQSKKADNSGSSDGFEEISIDDFMEDGFSDPNKIDDDIKEGDEADSEVTRDEDLADEIKDEDLPDIDMDLKELEEEVFLDESSFLDPKKIESDEILNTSLDDNNLDDVLETDDLENTTLPTAEDEIDEIKVDEIPDIENEEGLQELELDMDDELTTIQDTEMNELDAGNELDELSLEDVSLDMDKASEKLDMDDELPEMPELSDDLDIENTNESIIESTDVKSMGGETIADIELEDTDNTQNIEDMQGFEELDIEEDFAGTGDNKADNENIENEDIEIEELAMDDFSGDIGNEPGESGGEAEIEELILDEEFSELNLDEEKPSENLDDMNASDELVLNEELPDTVNESGDEFDHILDIDEEGESLKQKADSMEELHEFDLDGGLGLEDNLPGDDEISQQEAGMDESFMDLEKSDLEVNDAEINDSEIIEVSLSEEDNIDKEPFEDFSDITEVPGTGESAATIASSTGELSLLQKIEKELNSIKNELSGLKTELAQLRKNKGIVMKPEVPEAQGFFDEEEDETIALTGDELNNILNTADITEEMADDQETGIQEISAMDSEIGTTPDEISLNEVPMDETWSDTPEIDVMEMDNTEVPDEMTEEIMIDVPDAEENPMELENIPEEEISLDISGEEETAARDITDDYTDLSTEDLELEEPDELPIHKAADKKADSIKSIPENLKNELKSVLSYMDQLLEALPEEKIKEFANSDYFNTYKKLFEELGLAN